MAAMGVALGIPGAHADDLAGSEQIAASEADDAASMATDGGGRRLWSRQPGTSSTDGAIGVATDTDGNAYVVGGDRRRARRPQQRARRRVGDQVRWRRPSAVVKWTPILGPVA
jgi:hypothetical protein